MAMKLKKRLLKSHAVQLFLSFLLALILRTLYATCRITRDFPAMSGPFQSGEKRAIYTFWHGRLIMQLFLKPPGKFIVLSSHHSDGSLAVNTMRRFGIEAVRGSKNRGSTVAIRKLMEMVESGANIALTPDGPRGPHQVAAAGAIYLSMRTGLPIIPIAFSATRHWRMKSWDRFMIPKPFSHIVFSAGDPLIIPTEMKDDEIKKTLAHFTSMQNAITEQADRACGVVV